MHSLSRFLTQWPWPDRPFGLAHSSLRLLILSLSKQAHLADSLEPLQTHTKGGKVWPKKTPLLDWTLEAVLLYHSGHLDSCSKLSRSTPCAEASIYVRMTASESECSICMPSICVLHLLALEHTLLECYPTGCQRSTPSAGISPGQLLPNQYSQLKVQCDETCEGETQVLADLLI